MCSPVTRINVAWTWSPTVPTFTFLVSPFNYKINKIHVSSFVVYDSMAITTGPQQPIVFLASSSLRSATTDTFNGSSRAVSVLGYASWNGASWLSNGNSIAHLEVMGPPQLTFNNLVLTVVDGTGNTATITSGAKVAAVIDLYSDGDF